MRLQRWPGIAAVLLALPAAAGSTPSADNASIAPGRPAVPEAVRFNPPVDRDLLLEISDRRQLRDGREVLFRIENRLRFTRGEGGMIATIRRSAIDCAGPAEICATYRRAMAGWVGSVNRYAVDATGAIITLVDSDVSAVGDGLPEAQAVLAQVEQQRPGALGMAELREALVYVGQSLDPQMLAGTADQPPDEINVDIVGPDRADISSTTLIRLDSDPAVAIIRDRRDQVDLTTGLVIESVVTSRDARLPAGSGAVPFSDRRWRLTS